MEDVSNVTFTYTTPSTNYGEDAEYVILRTEAVVKVPKGREIWRHLFSLSFSNFIPGLEVDPVEAAPLLCAGVTTYNSLRNTNAVPGDLVAVQGIGGQSKFNRKMYAIYRIIFLYRPGSSWYPVCASDGFPCGSTIFLLV